MLHQLAEGIIGRCLRYRKGQEEYRDVYVYGLECAISETIQLFLLGGLALWSGRPIRVILFALCFTSLKRNIGGYHAASHFSCITVFTGMTTLAVELAGLLPALAARTGAVLCCVLSAALVWKYAPVAHPNHPKSARAHRKSRKAARITCVLQGCLLSILALLSPGCGVAGAMGGAAAAATLLVPNQRKGGATANER